MGNVRGWCLVSLLAAWALAPAAAAERSTHVVTRCGAKLVKAGLDAPAAPPEVRVLEDPGQWRLLRGEARYGVNAREFFFNLEADGDRDPPPVEVRWPGVTVTRVLGAAEEPQIFPGLVRLRPRKGTAPTGVRTAWSEGFIHLCIFHNWEVRRAGPYREGPWPAGAIQAQLNFLFAAREACRAMGFHETEDPGFVGDIRLYGFETNFPNGHADHPPHFHIMLAWPGWLNTQVCHFRLNEAGRVEVNEFMVDDGQKVTSRRYGPGEVCRLVDRNGKVGLETVVTEGGEGVVVRRGPGGREYRLGPDAGSGSALEAVETSFRDPGEGAWQLLCSVRATDSPALGELRVRVRPRAGNERIEVFRYDVDTGALLSGPTR